MWDGHFINILIEIRVQPSNVNGFFGLCSDLRGILVNNAKIIDGRQWVMEIFTMFKNGLGCGLGVFFDPLTKGSGGFSDVG